MLNIDCTLLKSIEYQIKKSSVLATFNMEVFKKILSIIILSDIIEWAEKIEPESSTEVQLVQLRNKLVMCYEQYLNICRTYTDPIEETYTNVNTPQTNYDWDRIWDNISSGCSAIIND